ncbi:MAG: IS21-like element helper ATPase IstB [Anaerosomatales bacterium]|nr:IS21-like element helper ATPase IstB [Anaerosomatales bacterium]
MNSMKKTVATKKTVAMTSYDDDIDQLLTNLKFKHTRDILQRELEHAEKTGVSYKGFLARLLREEYQAQQTRFMEHRIRRAKLPERWSLTTFPWEQQTGVSRRVIEQLAELDFVSRAANIVFVGPTGVGKTGLASAILHKALEAGYSGLFIKAQDLFEEMYRSLADYSSRKLLNRLTRLDLLLIDEMGYLNLRPEQSNIFFKLMEERYGRRATIITTNLPYDSWYEFLGNKEMVAALLDRLRHHCHTVQIDGPSLRIPAD